MGADGRWGDVLRNLRRAAGRSLPEASGEAGVGVRRLRRYEESASYPGYRDLIRLANYYGMGAGELSRLLAGGRDRGAGDGARATRPMGGMHA